MNEIKKVKKNNKKLYAKKKKIDPSVIIKKKEKEREGSLRLFIVFYTIVGAREPNYGDVCLSLCVRL